MQDGAHVACDFSPTYGYDATATSSSTLSVGFGTDTIMYYELVVTD